MLNDPRPASSSSVESAAPGDDDYSTTVRRLWGNVRDGDARDAVVSLGALQVMGELSVDGRGTSSLPEARQRDALGVLDTLAEEDTEREATLAFRILKDAGLVPSHGALLNDLGKARPMSWAELELETGADRSAFGSSDFVPTAVLTVSSLATALALNQLHVSLGTFAAGLFIAVAPAVYVDEFFTGGRGRAKLAGLVRGRRGRRRRAVHEAGHLVMAHWAGYALRGVSVDAGGTMWSGGAGGGEGVGSNPGGGGALREGGVVFWDQDMARAIISAAEARATGISAGGGGRGAAYRGIGAQLPAEVFDKFAVVLFAGVAAEALVLGSSEGGDHDEAVYRALAPEVTRPRETVDVRAAGSRGTGEGDGKGSANRHIVGTARWALWQAYARLQRQRRALDAVAREIEEGKGLAACVAALEANVECDATARQRGLM